MDPDCLRHELGRPLVHAERSGAQARTDHRRVREGTQRGEGPVLTRRTVDCGEDDVGTFDDPECRRQGTYGLRSERIRASPPRPVAADGQLVDGEPAGTKRLCDCGGSGQGNVVLGALSAADHHDSLCHAMPCAGSMLRITRGPMPVTIVCGIVPAQRAQSWMVGVAPPSGPNTVADVPTG